MSSLSAPPLSQPAPPSHTCSVLSWPDGRHSSRTQRTSTTFKSLLAILLLSSFNPPHSPLTQPSCLPVLLSRPPPPPSPEVSCPGWPPSALRSRYPTPLLGPVTLISRCPSGRCRRCWSVLGSGWPGPGERPGGGRRKEENPEGDLDCLVLGVHSQVLCAVPCWVRRTEHTHGSSGKTGGGGSETASWLGLAILKSNRHSFLAITTS